MNTIVDKLLDVDKEARALLDEAQQYYEKTVAEIEVEKQQLYNEYKRRVEKHIASAHRAHQSEAEEAITTIKARQDAIALEMESVYQQNHKQWQDDLFQRCVTGW